MCRHFHNTSIRIKGLDGINLFKSNSVSIPLSALLSMSSNSDEE